MNTSDLIINFTPTGMIPTKDLTPFAAISPAEIINDVRLAWDIGITMVHLHARDIDSGKPSCDASIFKEIILGIREFAPELIFCATTSGRMHGKFEDRAAALYLQGEAKPDMASLTLSSVNFNKRASVNEPDMIKSLAQEMKNLGIKPELEAFDAGMINYARYLIAKGIIEPPYYFNLILGNIACAQADPLHAGVMIRDLPAESYWSLGGIGNHQLRMNAMSIAIGGGVRVGLEDNIWFDVARTEMASNSSLLQRVHKFAKLQDRGLMSSVTLRERLNLSVKKGFYGVAT